MGRVNVDSRYCIKHCGMAMGFKMGIVQVHGVVSHDLLSQLVGRRLYDFMNIYYIDTDLPQNTEDEWAVFKYTYSVDESEGIVARIVDWYYCPAWLLADVTMPTQ